MLSRARLTSRPSSRETGPEFLRKSQGAVPAPLGKLAPKVAQASEALTCAVKTPSLLPELRQGKGAPQAAGLGQNGAGHRVAGPAVAGAQSAGASSRRTVRKCLPPSQSRLCTARHSAGQRGPSASGLLTAGRSSANRTFSRWICWSSMATRSLRAARVCSSWGLGAAPAACADTARPCPAAPAG